MFRYLLVLASILLLAAPQVAEAQFGGRSGVSAFSGGTTRSGTFGARSIGGGIGARSGTQFGGSQVPDQSTVGQITGNERFLRDARQPGQFVGADAADAANPFSQMQGGFNLGSGIEQLRAQQRQMAAQPRGQQNDRSPVRVTLSVGFSHPTVPAQQVDATITNRLARISQLQRVTPIAAEVHQGVVRLTGIVPSERDRALAEQLVRLEPGVSGVQNDLQVAAPELLPAPAAEGSPTSAVR